MTGLRVVHDLDNPNTTSAIFVHGHSGKQNDTWANYTFSDEKAIALTREGLQREAIQLLEGLLTLQRARGSKLVFVAHDIGGALVKEALIQSALGDLKFRDIFWSTSALVFIGCLHSSKPSAALQ